MGINTTWENVAANLNTGTTTNTQSNVQTVDTVSGNKFDWNNLVTNVASLAGNVWGKNPNTVNQYPPPAQANNSGSTILVIVAVLIAGVLLYKIVKK